MQPKPLVEGQKVRYLDPDGNRQIGTVIKTLLSGRVWFKDESSGETYVKDRKFLRMIGDGDEN
jgi:hypothetical protein